MALEEKILELLKGVNKKFSSVVVTPIERTGNNKVLIVTNGDSVYFVKQYFDSNLDNRNRFQSEVSFIKYAHLCTPGLIPEIYAVDENYKLIIFENIVGEKLTVEDINEELILKVASFFSDLNKTTFKLTDGKKIMNASEACFSIENHINLIDQRIISLEKTDENYNQDSAFFTIINSIRRHFEEIKLQVLTYAKLNNIEVNIEIEERNRVISPSDFGFHNCLKKEDNTLVFVDFEYAGWDDPAKVAGDFFSQLQVPVPEKYFDFFVDKAFENLSNKKEIITRARLLLPLYKIKWTCIALNVFIPVNLERRLFSNPNIDVASLKECQIHKAKAILNNIENSYNVIH